MGRVLVLLPPSESKREGTGHPFDVAKRPPPLRAPTEQVLDAVMRLCAADPFTAARMLKLSDGRFDLVHRNADLAAAGTAPAWKVYTGVLYDALGFATLRGSARRRGLHDVWVSSALFGFVALGEAIPAYRLSAGVTLPGLPPLKHVWSDGLTATMRQRNPDLILDLRSGPYAALWPVPADLRERTVTGRILELGPEGERVAMSHHNKAVKGRLLRSLLTTRRWPTSTRTLLAAMHDAGWDATLEAGRLDVLATDGPG